MTKTDLRFVAVLDTSRARKIEWNSNGMIEEAKASQRLLDLLEDGYEVYIASTRRKLDPEGFDKCLFDLIPEDRFFTPDVELDVNGSDSVGLMGLWGRVLTNFGIKIPKRYSYLHDPSQQFLVRTWLDLRHVAQNNGITIR